MKFSSCFKLMKQIIKDLKLNASDEVSILKDLSKWEKSGISLLSGTPIGLELVNEIREQTRDLAEYAQTVVSSADGNIVKIQKELVEMTKRFYDRITYIEKELEKKTEDDKLMKDRLLCLEEKNTLLETELERRDQETIPKHKRDQHEETIKQWQSDDKTFFITRATKHVISKIFSSNIAVVTGSSGSGKSFLIHHVALHLHSTDDYEIVPSSFVTAPADIINYRNEKRNQVFVIDDICGKENVNLQIVQTWKDLASKVEEIFQENVIESRNATWTEKTKIAKLLISCRLQVFKDRWFQRLLCFTRHECNILAESLCLLPEERLLMINKYLPNDRINKVNDILNEFNFFPLLCRLSTNRSSEELRNLFLTPIATIRADIEEIRQTENKFKHCALVLCILFEEGFDEQWLKFELVPNDIQNKLIEIGRQFGISLDVEIFRLSLTDAFFSLTGTYLRKTGTNYLFVHDKIYDIAAVVFGQHFKECLIKFASESFIGDRYVFESLGTTNNESVIIISEDIEEYYFKRLTIDLSSRNIYSTLHNKQLVFELFRIKLVQFFEKDIEVSKSIFNQLDESGIIMKIDYNDDLSSFGDEIEEHISSVLIEAISEGYEDIIEFLIKLGCEVNVFDSDGRSPLYTASERGFTNVVKLLLNHHCDVSTDSLNMYCPLTVACKNGYTDIVKLLIDSEVDVCQMSLFDGTPLTNACEGGHLDIVELLLQQGADVNECDTFSDHYPPLTIACIGGYPDIVEILLANNANITPSSLEVACEKGHDTIVNILLKNKTAISLYENKMSPLYIASGNGHLNVVKLILNSDIDISHFDKWTSVCVASHQGYIDIVKILIENGTDVAFCDINGYSPMYAACQGGSLDIVEFLIQQNVNLFDTDKRGWSLLHAACYNIFPKDDHLSVINLLLDQKLELSLTCNNGFTPLSFASVGDSVDIVKLLLKRGADVNHHTDKSFTSLHIACKWKDIFFLRGKNTTISLLDKNGKSFEVDFSKFGSPFPIHIQYRSYDIHRSIVQLLLEHQADVSLRNYKGQTALHIACESGDCDVVEMLLERKADIAVCDNEGNSPLDLACQREHTDVVKLLLVSITDISQLDNDGKTVLHSVCKGYGSRRKDEESGNDIPYFLQRDTDGHKSIIELLFDKHADIYKRNKHGETPLHLACEYGPVDIVAMLLKKGADISLCDNKGQSTVFKACGGGNDDILDVLLEKNANVSVCDKDGNSPLHVTCKNRGRVQQKRRLGHVKFPSNSFAGSFSDLQGCTLYTPDGFERVFKILVPQVVNLNIRNNCQQTPLHVATKGGHMSLVKMLIDRNADVNMCDNKGQSPLYLACKFRHIDITKLLLSHNADLTLVDDKKRSPLHAVCNVFSIPLTEKEIQDLLDLITLLIEYRMDLSHPDNEGKTALHFACKAGCLSIVELLAVNKANFTVCDFNGQTPLDEAKNADHCDIVHFLECFEEEMSKKYNFFYFLW
ncbi:ankyrin-1-like [Mytilus californianus]|uniref:ankyrin-1-like n=1 Tax=Mytilus californianus TaxID=6549 RepID=UPI0022467B9F|nr:ankyrin-1-like [Mytilus californianus]